MKSMFVVTNKKIQDGNKTHCEDSLYLCPVKFFIIYFYCVLALLLEMDCYSVAV